VGFSLILEKNFIEKNDILGCQKKVKRPVAQASGF